MTTETTVETTEVKKGNYLFLSVSAIIATAAVIYSFFYAI